MNSLILLNYFEKQAKFNGKLQLLLTQAAQCLVKKEEQRSLKNALVQENLLATMDVYDLECVAEQLKLQYQQQYTEQQRMQGIYKYSVEFFVQVRNIDWDGQLQCKLKLQQMQCQNEIRELSEEYEAERQARRELEQRPMVQTVRAAEKVVTDLRAKMENIKKCEAKRQAVLLEQLQELRNERNAVIVCLVTGSKQTASIQTELETLKNYATDGHFKELVARKQELITKLRTIDMKLPDFITANYGVTLSPEQISSKMDNSPTTTKLEAFLNSGNASNAIVCEERKELNFMELFKEWEANRQLEFQNPLTITTIPCNENASNVTEIILTSLEANHTEDNDSDISKPTPRSILRRRSFTEDEDSSAVIPKKRVRFATPEVEEREFVSPSALEATEDEPYAIEDVEANTNNDTFVIEADNALFNGDTETIEIFSTDEAEAREITKLTPNKPKFLKARNLVKNAKLHGSQKLKKMSNFKNTPAGRPKIEIQECRIVKPAGTKLPTKLPIDFTPESPLTPPTNQTISPAVSKATTDKIFKSPPKSTKRKSRKITDCDAYFREFLKQSDEDDPKLRKNVAYEDLKEENPSIVGGELPKTHKPSKSKRKKTEMDFDRFYHEAMSSNNSPPIDIAAAMQVTSKGENADNDCGFNLNFNENQGLLGDSDNDLFSDQADDDDKDDDLSSFDFDDDNSSGGETSKTNIFL